MYTLQAQENNFDFRKVNWGMSKEQVKISEKSATFVTEWDDMNMFVYSTNISLLKSNLYYTFVDNKLSSATYEIEERYINKDAHISDYKKIVATLTEKYGEPLTDEINWSSDVAEQAYSQLKGTAVSMGYLEYYTSWETTTTIIRTQLKGENLKVSHLIHYQSKELKELEKNKKIEKDKSDF